MKLKCVKNHKEGCFFGYDFRGYFNVGKSYGLITASYGRQYVYSPKGGWLDGNASRNHLGDVRI